MKTYEGGGEGRARISRNQLRANVSDVENTRKRNDFRGKFYILFHPARVIQTHVGGSLKDKDAHRRHATNGAMKEAKLQDEIPEEREGEIIHGKKERTNNTI